MKEAKGGILRLLSPAKVNLGLRVLGVRPDGYHEVVTWIQQVSLFDRVTLEEKPGAIRLRLKGEGIPGGRENLAWRAAALLKEAAGDRSLGVSIRIEKRIPAGAGLGGGSGNAAVVLWGLNRLWGLGLPPAALRRLGASLGADVPAFLVGPAAVCRGRGERVSRGRPLRRGWFILAKPRYLLPTASVYGWMREKLRDQGRGPEETFPRPGGKTPSCRNDLEEVVFEHHPDLAAAREGLLRCGAARARMSGSGSALWGFFASLGRAEVALARFRPGRGWQTWLTRPLVAAPFGEVEEGQAGKRRPAPKV